MSTPSRILLVCHDADVTQAVTLVLQPMGHGLTRVATANELTSRYADLRTELVVLDADSALCRDAALLADVLGRLRATSRPQVLLLVRGDDSLRERIGQAALPDETLLKPFDRIDLEIRIRALLRVQRVAAQSLRDCDILNSLFELSTFSGVWSSTDDVLLALARRVAEWTGLAHVVVTLGPGNQPRITAEAHKQEGLGWGRNGPGWGPSLLDRRHAELVLRGDLLLLDEAEGTLAGEDPSSLPYVGVPLRSQNGEVLGVLHAWGEGHLPSGANLRVMRVAAERISTEIQIHTSNRRLEEMVETRTADLTAALDRLRGVNAQLLEGSRDTVMRLARAAEYRDGDTGEHVDRMSSYSQVIARQMGMPAEEQGLLKLAAPMHDVGKIGIRDSILLKQGRLTQDEYEQMKEHPTIGARILGGSRAKLLQMAEQIAYSHHERWDGTGYPRGLAGSDIPLVGRIVALADVFDALTTPRVYKDAWSVDDAVQHIQRERGRHFDPQVVAAFEQCLDRLLEIRATYLYDSQPLSP